MLASPVVFAEARRLQGDADGDPAASTAPWSLAAIALAGLRACPLAASAARWRAVCDDPLAAAMCGVDVPRVFPACGAVSAASAAALAGVMAGSLLRQYQLRRRPGLRVEDPVRDGGRRLSLAAARGRWAPPAFGMAESLWSGYFPIEWRDAWMYLFLVAMLVLIGRRPRHRQDPPEPSDFGCMTRPQAARYLAGPAMRSICRLILVDAACPRAAYRWATRRDGK